MSPPASAFLARGFAEREFFRHSAAAIRKQYPDTFLILQGRGVPPQELLTGELFQINLYSDELSGLPDELWTDRQVNWHNQQLGQKGLVAAAGLYLQGDSLAITAMQSDVCQQLYRHADFKRRSKTQIDSRFGHWYRMLINAILDFAIERGVASVRCPTARSVVGETKKSVRPDLFERIYDSPARNYGCRQIVQGGTEYWEVSLSSNANRIVRLTPAIPPDRAEPEKSICIFHDIEEDVDTRISPGECRESLKAMLEIENNLRIAASYNILGRLFRDKHDQIRTADPGHALAFHSYNHDLADESQLTRCREVDLQVKGYRPPRSILTNELTDYRLSYLNFEWLASGSRSLGASSCFLQNGIVKIPISMDDYPLVTGQLGYEEWERQLLDSARNAPFFAFGLHDCYASTWLRSYPKLLEKLAAIGTFVTADQVCDLLYWREGLELPGWSQPAAQS